MTDGTRGKSRHGNDEGQEGVGELRGVRELKTDGRPEQAEGESDAAKTQKEAVIRRASIRRTRRSG
jgi:uncharacterized protein YjbJ (UPF0337 family)